MVRALPDQGLLALISSYLDEVSPGDPLDVLRSWRERRAPLPVDLPGPVRCPGPPLLPFLPPARSRPLPAPPLPRLMEPRPLEGGTPEFERFGFQARRQPPPAPSEPWIRLPGKLEPGEYPPATVVHLVVLPVEQVRRSRDVFECDVYEARIKAKTCLARQYTAAELKVVGRGAARQRLGTRSQYVSCGDCAVGRRIHKQVVPRDRKEIVQRVLRVKDGRLPPKYASGPIRE
jgi:hypothetical protein